MTNKISLLFLIAVITTGCSSANKVLRVGFDSNPRGASIVCNGRNMGYTPYVLTYTPTAVDIETNSAMLPSCQLKWSSGATVNVSAKLIHDLQKSLEKGRSGLFQRPNVSGYEKDAAFVLKVESLRAQQSQAAATRSAANATHAQADAVRQQTYQ